MGKQTINKGHSMEELLRNYFIRSGYFVVRGVPFVYEGFDVTDIDLWLYGRNSSVSREITIVDIKNRRTPQAIERIFWVQGLKTASKATNAIVATTDKRPEVKDFGKELGVVVLDGNFLNKLSSDAYSTDRLTEEEFKSKIENYALEKLDGDWKGRMMLCKSLLSKTPSFDSCNEWLNHSSFFMQQVLTKPKQREIALRCTYFLCSLIAISVDFLLKELSFLDAQERLRTIKEGFTYGTKGSSGLKKVLNLTMGLVEHYANDGKSISNQVRSSIERQLQLLPTNILAEYFSKIDVAKQIFSVAKEFEHLSMQKTFSSHLNSSLELRGMFSCFLDYAGVDRAAFSDAIKESFQ